MSKNSHGRFITNICNRILIESSTWIEVYEENKIFKFLKPQKIKKCNQKL